MAFTDRIVQYPGRVKMTPVSGQTDVYDMTAQEGTVTTEGTLLNAANLNAQTQLDNAVLEQFQNAGMGGGYQNNVSDALNFTANKIIAEQITLSPVSPFALYAAATPITAVKMGNVVMANGVVKVTANTALDQSQKTICTLPEGWRPAYAVYTVTQGSGTEIALLDVTAAGQIRLGRLRDMANANGAYTTATSSMWFPFTLTFVTA